jgi:hypothetical protein
MSNCLGTLKFRCIWADLFQIYVYTHTHTHTHIYIYREREREGKRKYTQRQMGRFISKIESQTDIVIDI